MMLDSQSTPSTFQILALVIFICALLHTFLCPTILKFSRQKKVLLLLGEVELVFAFWSVILLLTMSVTTGARLIPTFLGGLSFHEPLFVFAVMIVSSSRPIIDLMRALLTRIPIAPYIVIFGLLPLLGSLITEPAAMTIAALMGSEIFFSKPVSTKFKYVTLGILFVNISIGGTLTSFAAPPILMVTESWNWNTAFVFGSLGWKSILACSLNAAFGLIFLRKDLKKIKAKPNHSAFPKLWISSVHLLFLSLLVIYLHHPFILGGLILFFIGFTQSTDRHQSKLKFRDASLVAAFLGGLVIIGSPQDWWLTPLLSALSPETLGMGSIALTAITDNAALTYLGTLIPTLSEMHKFALVAGAVTGGGLTIIANAPNPAGFQILKNHFEEQNIKPIQLLLAALPPTLIAWICLWYLPAIRF